MIKKFELPKYYDVFINIENGEVKVFSSSKHAKGRELSQYKNKNGYLKIKLNNKNVFVHSLVSRFILGDRPKDYVVNHIDGNKLNNRPSNLEYVTVSENIKHSIKSGLHICNKPELMGKYKDGRCKDINKYKKEWYIANRDRILEKVKKKYLEKKQSV
jgi:hypothetical protein